MKIKLSVVKFKKEGGDILANIRIDNLSGDTVTVFLDEMQQTVEEDGRVTFDSLEKTVHTLRIHRTRVPLETATFQSEQEKSFQEQIEGNSKSLHTPLDYVTEIDLNSSRAVITVKSDVTAKEGKGLDVIFASYSVTATGAKIENGYKTFANSAVKKSFVSYGIKNTLFPTGVCGIIVLLLAIVSLVCAIAGNPIDLGGTEFTLPWASGLTAVSVAVCGYAIFCIINVIKTAKELSI